jgi:pSer/pThr/pTyr-binding forkhead associated (FHA) protein
VSRLHAELLLISGEWIAIDDGLSANGTWVHDARLNGRRRLRDGDLICIGETILAFCRPAEVSTVTVNVSAEHLMLRLSCLKRSVSMTRPRA